MFQDSTQVYTASNRSYHHPLFNPVGILLDNISAFDIVGKNFILSNKRISYTLPVQHKDFLTPIRKIIIVLNCDRLRNTVINL